MIVASLLDGRVRVRDEALKREPLATRVRDALLATPGVAAAEVNPRVGSMLVLYDATLAAVDQILETVAGLLGTSVQASGETAAPKRPARMPLSGGLSLSLSPAMKKRVVNIGMLASLALSVAAAVLDFKKLHILAGILFLALFGDHLYMRKEHMFA